MLLRICEFCKQEFQTYKAKFCSKLCYSNSRKGIPQSKELVEKRRSKLIGIKCSDEKKKKIGTTKTKILSSEIVEKIKELLAFGMPDGYILENIEGLSNRTYSRYKKELYPSGIPWQIKWLEKDISVPTIEEIIKYSKLGWRYKRIAKNIGLNHKTVKLILKSLNKRDPEIKCISYDKECWNTRQESSLEKEIREFLIKENIEFTQEKQLEQNSKWYFDFHILNTNLVFEINGDYWHCNPKIYPSPMNEYQRWAMRRDFAKKNYAAKNGFVLKTYWELDMKTDIEQEKEKIKKDIEQCKQLQ
jgi:hypothetical protein